MILKRCKILYKTLCKVCLDLMIINGITARSSFHCIWIAGKKLLVKRAPVHEHPTCIPVLLLNSSPPMATDMHQWIGSALFQIMSCCLFGAKPLSKPMLAYCQLNLRNKLQWNFNQNTQLFIHGNAYKNIVCVMAAILSWGRWVKWQKMLR